MRTVFSVVLVVASALAGCGEEKPAKKEEPKADSKPKAAATASASASGAAAPAAPKGDPAIVEAAKKVVACEWSGNHPKYECEAKKEWDKLEALKEGAGDATLVALLADADAKLNYVGAMGLSSWGRKFRDDKALAEQVLAKLEAEQGNEEFLGLLGSVAGYINAEKTGLGERLKAVPGKLKTSVARERFIGNAQFSNNTLMYDVTTALAKSEPNDSVRYAAVSAFWTGTPSGKDEEVCQLWHDVSKDEKATPRLQAQAAYLALFTSRGCPKVYDALIDHVSAKLKGEQKDSTWVSPFRWFVTNNKASDAQKDKAIAVLKTVAADTKNNGWTRADAMNGVAEGDKKGAKAYLTKMKGDKDAEVKRRAEEQLKRLDEEAKKK